MTDAPGPESEPRRDLPGQVHSHRTIAELSRLALSGIPLTDFLHDAAALAAAALDADLTEVLEVLPDTGSLLLRAGAGWRGGLVGTALLPIEPGSPAARAMRDLRPLLVAEVAGGPRTGHGALLREHGAVSGVCTVIPRASKPWGALGVYTRRSRTFTTADVDVLEAIAQVLALAVAGAHARDEQNRLLYEREQAELRLHHLLDATPDPMIAVGPSGEIVLVNARTEQVFGYAREELLGQSVDILVPAASRAGHGALRSGYVGDPRPRTMGQGQTLHGCRKDGSEFPVEVSLSPVETQDGLLVLASIRDITQRVAGLRALRESEAQYRRIVETAQEGIWVLDANNRTVYVNDRMARLLGYEPAEMLGRDLLEFKPASAAPDTLRMLGERQQGRPSRYDTVYLRKDGRELQAHTSAAPMFDEAGNFAGSFGMIMDITERRRAEAALLHRAFYDSLTGLPNRSLLLDRLQQAVLMSSRSLARPSLLFVGLDRFKDINETFGHATGDRVLRLASERLRQALRDADTVARLSGDEFAVVLPAVADLDSSMMVARRLRQALDEPFQVDDRSLSISASVGVVRYPDHGNDAETLLQRGGVAMSVAKRTGAGVALYAPEQDRNSPDRLSLLVDLRRAIDQRQLSLHFQPQVEMRSGLVVGVEALARWLHPERGLVPPSSFIPLAEDAGLMHQLTDWALEAALQECAAWDAAGLGMRVSVNLSVRNLQDPRLPDRLSGMLERYRVGAGALQVEITESSLMADPELALDVARRLRAMGIHIAIDDFGTGYSSLAYLSRLPVDEIKIDRSFVADIAEREPTSFIVRSTIDLGHNLGLRVVAEGIETATAWDRLLALNCDVAQGYLLSAALPAKDILHWAAARSAAR